MTFLLDNLDSGDGNDLQPAAELRSTGAWRRPARRRPDPTAPWASCTENGGPYGKRTATKIHSTHGESTPPPGHPPPQGATSRGGGGICRSGIQYDEFRFSRRPAAGVREMGRG